eukprot:1194682-Prorocentrum_minimum.AAC.2
MVGDESSSSIMQLLLAPNLRLDSTVLANVTQGPRGAGERHPPVSKSRGCSPPIYYKGANPAQADAERKLAPDRMPGLALATGGSTGHTLRETGQFVDDMRFMSS